MGGVCGKEERRLADDGEYYTKEEFSKHYGRDQFDYRWESAPGEYERRLGSDGKPHDPKWIFEDNTKKGGENWNYAKNGFKPGWTMAPKA